MDERRALGADEWAILDWFFDQWPELEALEDSLPHDRIADVFTADDGYRTLELEYSRPVIASSNSPFPGEAMADIDGRHFEALLFIGEKGLMLELIWTPDWPGRLPAIDELRPVRREAATGNE